MGGSPGFAVNPFNVTGNHIIMKRENIPRNPSPIAIPSSKLHFHTHKMNPSVAAIVTMVVWTTVVAGADSLCGGSQSYEVSVRMSFTPNIDPLIPQQSKARIPILVAVTHEKDFVLFQAGKRLNDSVAEVASAGTASKLLDFLTDLRETDRVADFAVLPEDEDGLIRVNDVVKFEIRAADSATHLTIIAQLSPSPSWFVGLESYALCRRKAGEDAGYTFLPETKDVVLGNFNAGLDKGTSFEADPDPYEVSMTVPVAPVGTLADAELATMSLVPTSSRFNWWIILLAVLLGGTAIALLVLLVIYIMRRIRNAKDKEDIPLTSNQRVEW